MVLCKCELWSNLLLLKPAKWNYLNANRGTLRKKLWGQILRPNFIIIGEIQVGCFPFYIFANQHLIWWIVAKIYWEDGENSKLRKHQESRNTEGKPACNFLRIRPGMKETQFNLSTLTMERLSLGLDLISLHSITNAIYVFLPSLRNSEAAS